MPSKNPEVQKRARDKWYTNNKQKQISRQAERRKELHADLLTYKKTLSCVDCGVSFSDHPEWLDFHHVDPTQKDDVVGQLARFSRAKVMAEIKKCIPLCSNCHRTRHRG